jgi:hypothetical protein
MANDLQKTLMTPADLICLFHGLTGLCVGWIYGANAGVLPGVVASGAGLIGGIITGFLVGHLPRAVRMTWENNSRKYRWLAGGFGLVGFAMGFAFWWACLNVMRR